MKWYLIFLLLLPICVIAQKRPSQTEINKMIQQAENEMKQLEKEDPEAAKLAREFLAGKKLAVSEESSKKTPDREDYIVKITLKKPVTKPTPAQATDSMLWFKGKKIDALTIITTNGTIAQLQPEKNRVVVQTPPKHDPFASMLAEMGKSRKVKDSFIAQMDKTPHSNFIYPYVKQGLSGIEATEKSVGSALRNTIEIPPAKKFQETEPGEGSGNDPAGVPAWVLAAYADVMEYYKAYGQQETFSIPPPPSADFDVCLDCDPLRRKEQERKDSLYVQAFVKEEREIFTKSAAVQRAWLEAGEPKDWKDIPANLAKVDLALSNRMTRRCRALLDQHGDNFRNMPVISDLVIAHARSMLLVGVDSGIVNILDGLRSRVQKADEYLEEQMKQKNFKTVLNFKWIIGLERKRQLLGDGNEGIPFEKKIRMLDRFNRFRLTIDVKAKVLLYKDEEGREHWSSDKLRSVSYYRLYPDSLCRFRLVPEERASLAATTIGSYEETLPNTFLYFDVLEAQSTEEGVIPKYYLSTQPAFSGGFCKERDTMVLQLGQPVLTKTYTLSDMLPKDQDLIFVPLDVAFNPHPETKSPGEPDAAAIIGFMAGGMSDNQTLNDMRMRSNLMHLESDALTPEHTGGLFLIGSMRNNSELVFESFLNGKENNPRADEVYYAVMEVRLEHAPEK